MHTSGVLRPGVYQSFQGPQSACVSQQLDKAAEHPFLESYQMPVTIAQFQQPGYVQSGSGNQRHDVPIVTAVSHFLPKFGRIPKNSQKVPKSSQGFP